MSRESQTMEVDEPLFGGMSVNRTAIPQHLLDIDSKQRRNLFPWNGQFSPQLIDVLLSQFAPPGGLVLDPFAGSGTVLHEAGRLGLPVVGVEINPAAFKMANMYCWMRYSITRRKSRMTDAESVLFDALPNDRGTLFGPTRQIPEADVQESLIAALGRLENEDSRSLLEALIILLDFSQEVTSEKVFRMWSALKTKVMDLPFTTSTVVLQNQDARSLPLEDDTVRLVLTSPPYINVFNYHQQYRKSVEALGWNPLTVARAEIGSNRKHRQNRFLTVIQYCLDMADVLREMQRVCQNGSRAIMILGRESNVRKTRFFNGEIMASLATRCVGFGLMMRQERRFQNRFGDTICEDILHFEVRKDNGTSYDDPRDVAAEVLISAKLRCAPESVGDLDDAIGAVREVQPSPLYDLASASNLSPELTDRIAAT